MADFDTVNRRAGNSSSGSQLGLIFAAVAFLICAVTFGGTALSAVTSPANASQSSLFID